MRTARPKPKKLAQAEVPRDLRAFLEKVAALIDTHDEAAMLPSDDLLQDDRAFGGLIDDGAGEYGFTYFPGEGVKAKWELHLSAAQIREIAVGSKHSLELWACTDDTCGSMFSSERELCFSCDYVDDETPTLPVGIFTTRRAWALAYFALHPDAHPLAMIGDFNGVAELGRTLGDFSLAEATDLLTTLRR